MTPTLRGLPFVPTKSGGRFYLADPHSSDFRISDIAAGLAKTGRFAGQTLRFYSYAEHCFRLSCRVSPKDALQAMLIYAHVAYVGTSPVFADAQEAIYRRFRVPLETPVEIQEMSHRLGATEARLLFKTIDPGWEAWLAGHKPIEDMDFDTVGWNSEQIEHYYADRLKTLWKAHSKAVPAESYKPKSFWETDRGHIHWFSYLPSKEE